MLNMYKTLYMFEHVHKSEVDFLVIFWKPVHDLFKHVHQTCTYLLLGFCFYLNYRTIYCVSAKLRNSNCICVLCNFLYFYRLLVSSPSKKGFRQTRPSGTRKWVANGTFMITFRNRAVVQAKQSPAVGPARRKKGTRKTPYGIKLVKRSF